MLTNTPKICSTGIENCIKRYGNAEQFFKTFCPDNIAKYSSYPEKCISGYAPTLNVIKNAYGEDVATSWLMLQLNCVNAIVGSQNKLSPEQTFSLAQLILFNTDFSTLKVTDIMLFINQLITGKYGCFYGSVDSQIIGEALYKYKRWKMEQLYEIEVKRKKQEREAMYQEWEKYKNKIGKIE